MKETAKRILIVDDEPDLVAYLGALLEDSGYDYCSASDGNEGMSAMRAQKPDLVLMDVKMPNQTGLQLYREMHELDEMSGIPVIMITGMTDFDLFSDDCNPLPKPAAFIQKPVDHGLLLSAIKKALG